MISYLGKKMLFWIVVLVIVPLGFVSFLVYSQSKDIIEEQIFAILKLTGDSVEAQLHSILRNKRNRVDDFSSDAFLQQALEKVNAAPQGQAFIEYINSQLIKNKKSLDPDILDIFVFDKSGRLVSSTNQGILRRNAAEGRAFDWEKGVLGGGIENSYREQRFSISTPVIDKVKGDFMGLLTITFKASTLDDILMFERLRNQDGNESSLLKKGRILIVDRNRIIISSNEPELIGKRIDTEIVKSTFETGRKATQEFAGIFGEPRIGVSMYIKEPQWVVVPSFNREDVFSPLRRLALRTFPFIYIGVISVIALTVLLTRRFTRSVSEVSRAARRIAAGDLDGHIAVAPGPYGGLDTIKGAFMRALGYGAFRSGSDEINQLIDSFNQMAESLQRSIHEKENFLSQIKESEEQYKTLFDYAEDSMLMLNPGGRIIAANKRQEDVLGFSERELLGREFQAILPDRWRETFSSAFDLALRGVKPPTSEIEVAGSDVVLTMEMDLTGIRQRDSVSFVQVHLRNVTERRMLEREVMLERNKLQTIVESMGDGLDIVGRDFSIQFMNKKFLDTFGADAIGKKCYEVYTSRSAPCDGCPLVDGSDTESVPEVTTRHGHTLLILHSPIKNMDGTVSYVEIFKDISEKKKLESMIRELELYNTLFNYAEDSMLMVDIEGVIVAVNKRQEKTLGYTGEEMFGKDISTLLRDKCMKTFSSLFEGVLKGEKPPTAEVEVLSKYRGPLTMEMDLTAIKRSDRLGLVVVHLRDITQRKELEMQLLRTERLAALSHLSSALAHDLRNPIIGIKQRLKSLQGTIKMSEADSRVLTDIIYGSELLLGMINDVLDVFRNSYEELPLIISEFQVLDAIQDSIKLLQIEAEEKRVNVFMTSSGKSLKIKGDKRRFQRVFINLLDNAIKFSAAGSRIDIEFEPVDEGGSEHLFLTIKDEGIGINPSKLLSIFEPLYKLEKKESKSGTGLGLYFCKVVVDAHGGRIWAENRPGGGAVFYIKIPTGRRG